MRAVRIVGDGRGTTDAPMTVHCGRSVIGRVIELLSGGATNAREAGGQVSRCGPRQLSRCESPSLYRVVRGSSPLVGSDLLRSPTAGWANVTPVGTRGMHIASQCLMAGWTRFPIARLRYTKSTGVVVAVLA
jgi:hypothetical protein